MTKNEFKVLIQDERHEMEFVYKGKRYSITNIGLLPNDGYLVEFGEFYKDFTPVKTFEELCNLKSNGVTVLEMIESLTEEDDYYIF